MTELPNDIKDIDRRLQQAKKSKKQTRRTQNSFVVFTEAAFRVTLDFAAPIIVAFAIGYVADKLLNTRPIIMIVCIVFGVLAGMLNLYKSARRLENKISEEK
ncbi:MAG: AtpZ/AtpI family protein [Alphaproteobacteria bacterium]|nr:AtpZ/AtpI family protein [Alphaproteobacteria bacterium]